MMGVRDEIKKWTGKDAKYWLDFIGKTAHRTAKPIKRGPDKGGLSCEPQLWVPLLTKAVWKAMLPKLGAGVDGNIMCAKLLSLIFTLWTCRIVRAKSYDVRRPLKQRKKMMERLTQYHCDLMDCVSDESHDVDYFWSQGWVSPFTEEKNEGWFGVSFNESVQKKPKRG